MRRMNFGGGLAPPMPSLRDELRELEEPRLPYIQPEDIEACVADWLPPGVMVVLGANGTWSARLPDGKIVYGKETHSNNFDVNPW